VKCASMPDPSIKDSNYQENPEAPDKEQWEDNINLFRKTGKLLWHHPRSMYSFIRDFCVAQVRNHPQYPKFIWKPKICEIGCGIGTGANVLSQEADFVWAIDKNKNSIKFAKEAFERNKNNIYYTPQLTFDIVDVLNEPRELMQFDIVTCIEMIEHINNYQGLIDFIKRLCKKNKDGTWQEPPTGTVVFISTPNRNSPKISKERPFNKFHVREWHIQEFYDVLIKNFKYVTMYDWKGNLVDLDTETTPVMAKCEVPI